jgi:hypothetical protein
MRKSGNDVVIDLRPPTRQACAVTVQRLVLLASCLRGVSAPRASAEIRTLAVDDPQDAVATVSRTPNNPDISHLEARYDSAGSLTITVHFYNDAAAIDRSQNYAFWGTFTVGGASGAGSQATCSTIAGSLNGQHHVYDADDCPPAPGAEPITSPVVFEAKRTAGVVGFKPNLDLVAEPADADWIYAESKCLEYLRLPHNTAFSQALRARVRRP